MPTSHTNPFATRFIKPGALPFLFTPGESPETLVTRLKANHWQGEIVAPHGSGKSTLLAALVPQLESEGRTLVRCTLRNGESHLPPELQPWRAWSPNALLIVDGYEQLAWWSRWVLAYRCRRTGAGCLVTSHRSAGFPLLTQLQPSVATAEQVVRQLGVPEDRVASKRISEVYHACQGNIREMLFQLYDDFEQHRAG
jgi:hypothetical protein